VIARVELALADAATNARDLRRAERHAADERMVGGGCTSCIQFHTLSLKARIVTQPLNPNVIVWCLGQE
jgi:hypothetical protein